VARPIPIADRARGAHAWPRARLRRDRSRRRAHWGIRLAALLAEELLEAEVDLRRIAERWIAWARRDGVGWAGTLDALEHLARYDAPGSGRPSGTQVPWSGRFPSALRRQASHATW
jgi:hypothetical protein